jgi:hypothetical protein
MRYVVVPEPVVLENAMPNPKTGEPTKLSMKEFVTKWLVADEKVMTKLESVEQFLSLSEGISDKQPGQVWGMTDEEHEFLLALVRGAKINPEIKGDVLHIVKAIMAAAKKNPSETNKTEEARA